MKKNRTMVMIKSFMELERKVQYLGLLGQEGHTGRSLNQNKCQDKVLKKVLTGWHFSLGEFHAEFLDVFEFIV